MRNKNADSISLIDKLEYDSLQDVLKGLLTPENDKVISELVTLLLNGDTDEYLLDDTVYQMLTDRRSKKSVEFALNYVKKFLSFSDKILLMAVIDGLEHNVDYDIDKAISETTEVKLHPDLKDMGEYAFKLFREERISNFLLESFIDFDKLGEFLERQDKAVSTIHGVLEIGG